MMESTMTRISTTRRQAGFTLIEALIALLVMAFGMLALSGMQITLSRSADVSKQRTEATRIAEERIERMRSFDAITGGTINWDALPTAVESVSSGTNATFTSTPALSGTIADAMRAVSVVVTWADRSGETQTLTLSSVISKTNPEDPGFLANPLPLNTTLKRPKNRNINIPIPALDLGNGKSSYQFSAGYAVIFSNTNGGVVQICNPAVANATVEQILASSCTTLTGYIVGGYIGRSATTVVWPTGINYAGVVRNAALTGQAINCQFSDAVNQSTGLLLTAADPGYNNGYKYYLCVIPLDTPFTWGGTVRIGGVSTTSNYLVCRYQYTQNTVTANERNIQPYVNVNQSIDEQNYQIVTSSSTSTSSLAGTVTTACPNTGAQNMTVAGVSVGVVHQDCRSLNPSRATECPAASP